MVLRRQRRLASPEARGPWTRLLGIRTAGALVLVTLACASTPPVQGSPPAAHDPEEPQSPALVVVVVVDQLGADLLERYGADFRSGLRRLLDGGFHFSEATHDHGITETSPGHATISTGTSPSQHGMVSNLWFVRNAQGAWEQVENVIDTAVRITGAESLAGSSPVALMQPALGDWLVERDPASRVVSVSGKDRAAILLAGQGRHTVYWFEPHLERFATSTYYRDTDPDWVLEFNEGVAERLTADGEWTLRVPADLLPSTRPDSASFEGDGVHTEFPHRYAAEGDTASADFGVWWSSTPYLDRETTSLAIQALEEMELGQRSSPDLLAVSLSATDRVGHAYGPGSVEQLDNLLRLDEELGRLLDALDASVGGEYALVLTADHGVSEAPEVLTARGIPARRLTREEASEFNQRAGADLQSHGSDPERLAAALAQTARAEDWIAAAWTEDELPERAEADSLASLMFRSLYRGRAAGLLSRYGVQMILTPHTLLWAWPRGTDHGSPYLYDRRVPLIFYGSGIESGLLGGHASTRSIAPTLAGILGIPVPGHVSAPPLSVR
ncbi:MAG: hypothetical protein HKN73_12110 [Gemmatimonadetes bacterium]|nr:hypothetical protein [Gemmatimonadota bacterium]